ETIAEASKTLSTQLGDIGVTVPSSQLSTVIEQKMQEQTAVQQSPLKVNLAQLQDASNNLTSQVLTQAGVGAGIVTLKASLAQQVGIPMHEGLVLMSGDIPAGLKQVFQEATGIDAGTIHSIALVPNRKGEAITAGGVSIKVMTAGDKTVMVVIPEKNFNDKNVDAKKTLQSIEKAFAQQQAGGEGVFVLEKNNIGGLLADLVKGEVPDFAVTTQQGEEVKKIQGQIKLIAFDSSFLVVPQEMTEEGIKAKLTGFISQNCVNTLAEGKTTKFMITENDSFKVKNESGIEVNINLHSLVKEMGYADDMFIVVDSNMAGAALNLPGAAMVTPAAINEVCKKKFGEGGYRIHLISPENNKAALTMLQKENEGTVTFSTFAPKIGNKIRNGDVFVAEALKSIIIGGREMTPGDKKALGAILAAIKIDMSQTDLEDLIGKPLESTAGAKTIDIDKEILVYIAPERWA
ncbi:MAG: hypothetical protein L6416_00115, partial [Candidatus Omnitrophica bacterium]|nr:hypothetical protein [Candidatus Omnitrophota bacterium]